MDSLKKKLIKNEPSKELLGITSAADQSKQVDSETSEESKQKEKKTALLDKVNLYI